MSTYEQFYNPTISAGSYAQIEKDIYGSSRLGIEKTFVELINNTNPPDPQNLGTARLMILDAPGDRIYELTNHLGNVLATITDRKIPVGDMNDNIIGYQAELYTANDYSAFGAPLKGRKFDKTICVPQTVVTPLVNEDFNGTSTANFVAVSSTVVLQGNRLRASKSAPTNVYQAFGMYKDFMVNSNSDYKITFDFELISSQGVTARVINLADNSVQDIEVLTADAFVTLTFSTLAAGNYRLELMTGVVNGKRTFRIDNLFIEETNHNPLCVNYGNYRYGFNTQEHADEISSGDYDFGARIYSSNLGRFLSIDPLAAKYPSFSPYHFAANSPILLVDRDGREIWISFTVEIGGKPFIQKVQYKNGELYAADGKKYAGSNAYFKTIQKQLNELKNDAPENATIINELQNSKNTHEIAYNKITGIEQPYEGTDRTDSPNNDNNSVIDFDEPWSASQIPLDDKNPVPSKVRLIHELKHSQEINRGTDEREYIVSRNGVQVNEINAVRAENVERKKLGLKPRTSYDGVKIEKELLEKKSDVTKGDIK